MNLIVATSKNNVIGNNGIMPWSIKKDLQYFKSTTLNQIVIMGRKTFKSLNFKPLKDRINIIITKNQEKIKLEYNLFATTFENLDNILDLINHNNQYKVFVIGGEQIYNLLLDRCQYIYLTYINKEFEGDTYFNISLDNYELESESQYFIENNNVFNFKIFHKVKII